jgi:hypothetical protein
VDTIALCAIFKDEAPFLLEWIAFHKMIGVDHFVLFDNGSDDGGSALVRESVFARNVTLVDWPDRPGQISAYRHYVTHHARRFTWSGFLDLDEFIHPMAFNSLRDVLRDPSYDGFSAILLNWLVFGASGHDRRPPGPVIDAYVHRLPVDDPVNRHVKSLVRSADLLDAGTTPHVFPTTGPACTPLGQQVPAHAMQERVCHEVMAINHYYTRSREDWDTKLGRGRADVPDGPAVRYRPEVFDELGRRATEEDRRITRFVPRLRWLLR